MDCSIRYPLTSAFCIFLEREIRMTPREMMELAVDLARHSKPENDDRPHPFVGAVLARGGDVLAKAYRGMTPPGGLHAEQEALAQIKKDDVIAGATVYSTLEPCVVRGKEMPCSQRLIDRRIADVYYGILDPNRDIRGQGEWKMEDHGIRVRKFDPDLVAQIRDMNRDFINYMLGLGIHIRNPEPGKVFDQDAILVEGTYRVRPTKGDNVRLFVREANTYYPQAPINFDFNRENSVWQCPLAWINLRPKAQDYEIIIARVSDDLAVSLSHYTTAYKATGHWIGIEMDSLPPGFERLASVNIVRSTKPAVK
jgi:pyrimidine deaminase RibD-like protein